MKQNRENERQHEYGRSTRGSLAGATLAGLALGIVGTIGKRYAMQAAWTVGKDWDEVLKAEHRSVEALFDKLRKGESIASAMVVGQIKRALTKHSLEEENVVYPVMAEVLGEQRASQLFGDHAEMKIALHALTECKEGDPGFNTRLDDLRKLVLNHVADEEMALDELKQKLSPEDNDRINAEMWREGICLS